MASMLLSAFSMEAYLNHLGAQLLPFWSTLDRKLGPAEKLEVIEKHLGLSIDHSRRPFQSFTDMFTFRNAVVHGRTEDMQAEFVKELGEDEIPPLPKTRWEKLISMRTAKRFLDDSKEMITTLQLKAGRHPFDIYQVESSGWST